MSKLFKITVVMVFVLNLVFSCRAWAYSGGDGSVASPYEIANAADLILLSNTAGDYNKCFKLTADIDLKDAGIFTQAVIAGDPNSANDTKFDGKIFTGSFDGDNHVISNLTVSGAYYCGLFGKIGSKGIIVNLGLENVNVIGTGDYIGGLCGFQVGGTMTNCYSSGRVNGNTCVGGLVGCSDASVITSSHCSCSVSGIGDHIGGLCGENYGSIISSYATGNICGGEDGVGGLSGINSGNITGSYASGSIAGKWAVGGLCGSNSGSVASSNASGKVFGSDWAVGGLCGSNSGSVASSYATGDVSGDGGGSIGGLCGGNSGSIVNSYSSGNVSCPFLSSYAGGLCGENNSGDIANCYSIGNVTGKCFVGGLCGRNSANGKISGSHSSGNVNGTGDVGGLCGVNFFGVIASSYCRGNTTSGDRVGGLVGANYGGFIESCYATGYTEATNPSAGNAGGLVGISEKKAYIKNCYATGSVTGVGSKTGGFCGYNNNSIITGCYSVGAVSSTGSEVGGFCGASTVMMITSSFWNTQTSGLTTSNGGIGITTAQMTNIKTFVNAGWDFTAYDDDPAEWQMVGDDGYPELSGLATSYIGLANRGTVNSLDFALLAKNWLGSGESFSASDLDNSGTVDMADFRLLAQGGLAEYQEPNTLVGYWKLDEISGTTAADSSTYTRSGDIVGTPVFATGRNGNCLLFDSDDDRVVIEGFRGVSFNTPRTTCAWIKADADPANEENNLHCVLSWGNNEKERGNAKWSVLLDDTTGQLALDIYGARLKGGPSLEDGQWHHVAAVLPDDSVSIVQVKLYVDGEEILTNAGEMKAIIDAAFSYAKLHLDDREIQENFIELNAMIRTAFSEVSIGALNSSDAVSTYTARDFFKGSIDDVRIYSVALTPEEIAQIAQ